MPDVFAAADPDRLRSQPNSKWTRYGPDVIPAWIAEMDAPTCPAARSAVEQLLTADTVGYPADDLAGRLADAFSGHVASRHGWAPDPALIRLVTGVSAAFASIVERFTRPGDDVILQSPVFPTFRIVVDAYGRNVVEHRAEHTDGEWTYDAGVLESLIGERTSLLVVVNPHNPLGRVFRRDELEAIAAVADRYDLLVVADEIYADLVRPAVPHVPFASLGESAAARTITLTAPAKSHNMGGFRCGVAHFGTAELADVFDGSDRAELWDVSTPSIVATTAVWTDDGGWLDEVVESLELRRAELASFLREHLPDVGYVEGDATYLAWLDCSALGLDEEACEFFEREALVALGRGSDYGSEYRDFVRLNFATSGPILSELLERMVTALDLRA